MTAKQTAAEYARTMHALTTGKITPDQYRAFVREHKPRFTPAEWQRITVGAVNATS